jgi:hypothetical protein
VTTPEIAETRTAEGRLPTFVIVGAAKSGTSSLAAYLAWRRDVFFAPGKEVYFFDENFEQGLDWYRRHFAEAGDAPAVGEATPGYMADPAAITRMAETIPEARLIALLRHPVDRAYSHYWHWRERKGERREFEEIARYELANWGSDGSPTWDPQHPENYRYLGMSRYLPQLQRIADAFSRDQLQVVMFDDLSKKPVETFQEVCRHVGIDDQEIPESVGGVFNSFTTNRRARVRNFMQRPKVARVLPGRAEALVLKVVERGDAPAYPAMDPQLHAELTEAFRADNDALAAWLGQDLSHWNA